MVIKWRDSHTHSKNVYDVESGFLFLFSEVIYVHQFN